MLDSFIVVNIPCANKSCQCHAQLKKRRHVYNIHILIRVLPGEPQSWSLKNNVVLSDKSEQWSFQHLTSSEEKLSDKKLIAELMRLLPDDMM
jgi:hypothetical protein